MKKVFLLTVLVVVLFSGSAFGQKLQIAMDYYPPTRKTVK